MTALKSLGRRVASVHQFRPIRCGPSQTRQKTSAPQNFPSYESLRQMYDPEVPEYFNFARDVLDAWEAKEKSGEKVQSTALWWVNEAGRQIKWSFEELGFHSRRLANVLSGECQLQRGDRVLLILPRIPEWWLVNVACLRTGTIVIPGTSQLTERDILHRLQVSKAKCVITDDSVAPMLDSVAPECSFLKSKLLVSGKKREGWRDFGELLRNHSCSHECVNTRSDEAMTIFFTSGTTGSPKMTQHSHCSFGIGLTVNGRYTFSNLQHCLCAGEPINPEVMEKWKQMTGLDIYEGYGQTETVLIAGTFKGMKIKPGSFGKPSPAYDVQLVDDLGNIVPQGKEGNIAIRVKPHKPFSLFTKYTDDAQRTADCYKGDFYLTGDKGVMDEEGYLWFVGRADDVILSAGYRIGPFEVENALIEHDAVAESAVVSSPDPLRGEVVKAFVVLTAEYKTRNKDELRAEIQKHVKKVTAPYKYPRKVIEFVDHLPKTVSGKIRRVELRNKEWGKS
uniref:medium-chain acyl-CoA ligase n=1 Tax=Denticeps clupeoides TaxID=299321 RepID=A0AAY4AP68_9TELE